MWLLNRDPAPRPSIRGGDGKKPEPLEGQALDTLAAVVNVLGTHALEVAELEPSEFRRKCEAWASHLLKLTAPPNGSDVRSSQRDWAGLRRFLQDNRVNEHRLVGKALGDLKQSLVAFIFSLNSSFSEDEVLDRQVLRELTDLAAGLPRASSTEQIKQRVLAITTTFSTVMERRRARHVAQVEDLGSQIHRLGRRLSDAEREKSQDALTLVNNRRVLTHALDEALALMHGYARPSTLLMIDVDHFKQVNDLHGHAAGDAVLQALANTLVRSFPRRSDVVARYGGEEFAVLLSDTRASDLRTAVERLLDAVRTMRVAHSGRVLAITVSVGVAEARTGDDQARWLERADTLMYAAKNHGRDRAAFADG